MAQKGNDLSAESAFLPTGGISLQLWAEMAMDAKVKRRIVKFKRPQINIVTFHHRGTSGLSFVLPSSLSDPPVCPRGLPRPQASLRSGLSLVWLRRRHLSWGTLRPLKPAMSDTQFTPRPQLCPDTGPWTCLAPRDLTVLMSWGLHMGSLCGVVLELAHGKPLQGWPGPSPYWKGT